MSRFPYCSPATRVIAQIIVIAALAFVVGCCVDRANGEELNGDTAAILKLMTDRVTALESRTASIDSRLAALEQRLAPVQIGYTTVCANGSCSTVPTFSYAGSDGSTVYVSADNSTSSDRRRLFQRRFDRRAARRAARGAGGC